MICFFWHKNIVEFWWNVSVLGWLFVGLLLFYAVLLRCYRSFQMPDIGIFEVPVFLLLSVGKISGRRKLVVLWHNLVHLYCLILATFVK